MQKTQSIWAIFLLCFPIELFGQSYGFVDSVASTVSRLPGDGVRVTNKTFELSRGKGLLIYQEIEETFLPGVQNTRPQIYAKAYGGEGFEILKWRIHDPGSEAKLAWDYYITTKYGAVHTYYGLQTGEKLLSFDSNLIEISPSRGINGRLIGFLSYRGTLSLEVNRKDRELFGILTYASKDSLKFQVGFYTDVIEDVMAAPPTLSIITKDGKERKDNSIQMGPFGAKLMPDAFFFTDFSIKISYDSTYPLDFLLYVKDDQLVLDRSEYPIKVRATFLGGEKREPEYLNTTRFNNLKYAPRESLRLLRNEIFARHGHSFQGQDLKGYFSHQSWYKEKTGHRVSESELTQDEMEVLESIISLEKKIN